MRRSIYLVIGILIARRLFARKPFQVDLQRLRKAGF